MKNQEKIKKIPVMVISTFGHCGIDWLHSLIDSHKEVLIIPPLSFFRNIEILKRNKNNLNSSLSSKAITNIIVKVILKKSEHESYNILSKNQSKSVFKKYINDFLTAEKNLNIEKKLFFAIHYAFAKINKINLDKIKIIVAHEHAPWNCYQYEKHFNSKFVFMLRDPRASFAGSLRIHKRLKNTPINFIFDMSLSYMVSAQKFFKKINKKKILVLRNEKMHNNLKYEMKKLSKWFNIQFNKSLLNPTFLGKKWIGDSSYLSRVDLKKSYPISEQNYYKSINVEKRWRSVLDKNTILIIETVFEKIMIRHQYKFDNKLNVITRVFGYLSLLLRFNQFNNFFYFIIGFIKSAIRRIFIIFFSKQSRIFFDIV